MGLSPTDDAGIKNMLGNIMKQLADLQQQIREGREENTDLRRELAETRTESAQVIHVAASGTKRDASGVPVPTSSDTASSGGVPLKAPKALTFAETLVWKAGAEMAKGKQAQADLAEVLENLATKNMLKIAAMGMDSYGKEVLCVNEAAKVKKAMALVDEVMTEEQWTVCLQPKTDAGRVELKSACREIQTAVEDKLATTLGAKKPNARSTIAGIARRIELVAEAEKKKKAPPQGVAAQIFKTAMGAVGMGGRGGGENAEL